MKAKAKAEKAVIALLTVSASYKAKVKGAASADAAKVAAITKSEQTIVALGDSTATEFKGKERETVRLSVLPVFIEAFTANGQTEEYAKQQLSRVLSIAFPGGAKADADSVKRGQSELAKGRKAGLGTNDLVRLANGKAVYDEKKEEIVSVGSGGSGGGNKKSPKETFETVIESALVALCKNAKKAFVPVALNAFVDVAVQLKLQGAKELSEFLESFAIGAK